MGHKLQRLYGWHALELGNEEPARAQPSMAQYSQFAPHPSSTPSALILADHVGLARAKTKMDNGHEQGAQVWPHHGPWRARSPSVSSGRLLAAGLSPQPTLTGAEPANPCGPWPAASRAALSGAHWRSLWRDFGSEKLWMREIQGSVHSQDSASFQGSRELHCSPAVITGSCFGSCSLQDGTRPPPLPRPAWLPGGLALPWT